MVEEIPPPSSELEYKMITAQEARLLTEEHCKKVDREVESICEIIKAAALEGKDFVLGCKELQKVAEIQITNRKIKLTDMQVKIVNKLALLGFVVESTPVKIYIGVIEDTEDTEDTIKISW
jgi:hypothetical protein